MPVLLAWISEPCPSPSAPHVARALARQAVLTKPAGALGRLESLAVTLAGLQATDEPRADAVAIVLFAGDHGVARHGVSAYPSAVTVQMLRNFAAGGAAVSVLARQIGARLVVADVGTVADAPVPGVETRKARCGTRDFTVEPALTASELAETFEAGRSIACVAMAGRDLVAFGEMGIANTASAAALAAALLGCRAGDVTGRGTGLDDAALARKIMLIDRALERHDLAGRPVAPEAALLAVGGFEIAALVAAIIAAAQNRVPVVVDGFIVTVAALLAVRINPGVRCWLLFGHRSAEQGHARVLAALDAEPLLDLGLRLGEGSGAALAVSVVRAAVALHTDMATFAEAGVTDRAE
ncbi:MAG: nicotinate-nucleotide--dimethylbenzimidazole phosphoribosyltransferase [Hyphomicrobiaceae bacterium]